MTGAATTLYAVADWSETFEKNRTKELKTMPWVPVPTKQDGDGYTELLDHPNGAAHFGAWIALLQVAAKCEPRGTLLRDTRGGVPRPHDAQSLSRITRIPEKVFKEVIPRLIEIGWLAATAMVFNDLGAHEASSGSMPQAGAGIPQGHAASRVGATEQNRRGEEENRTEEKRGAGARPREAQPSLPDLPDDLANIPGMPEAWEKRLSERRERKSRGKLTPSQVEGVFEQLRRVVAIRGPAHAVFCVDRARSAGNQGVVFAEDLEPLRVNGRAGPTQPALPIGATAETMQKFERLQERIGADW